LEGSGRLHDAIVHRGVFCQQRRHPCSTGALAAIRQWACLQPLPRWQRHGERVEIPGLYLLIAQDAPPDLADWVRELVLQRAVARQDHSLLDAFVRLHSAARRPGARRGVPRRGTARKEADVTADTWSAVADGPPQKAAQGA